VPDLCELLVVANATGLVPDTKALHAPIARIGEVPTMFAPKTEGGLLRQSGTLDVFHCLRAPDEVSLAGGVFIVVRCEDQETWRLLAGKGHIMSRDGPPRHAADPAPPARSGSRHQHPRRRGARPLQRRAAAPADPRPGGARHAHAACRHAPRDGRPSPHHGRYDSRMLPAAPLGAGVPVPFYLAANRRLVRDVAAGQPVCFDDIEVDAGSELLALRRSQDTHFFPAAQAVR
jgi:hypothetical protein